MNATPTSQVAGMSARTAGRIEIAIILLCTASLMLIFQPFNKLLSGIGIGMGLVVLGGLAFNLVPLCEPGRPVRDLLRAAMIVVVVFAVVLALALASAYLYGVYLEAQRAG
jgi:hypothetical protein